MTEKNLRHAEALYWQAWQRKARLRQADQMDQRMDDEATLWQAFEDDFFYTFQLVGLSGILALLQPYFAAPPNERSIQEFDRLQSTHTPNAKLWAEITVGYATEESQTPTTKTE